MEEFLDGLVVETDTTDDQNMTESQIRPFWLSDPDESDTFLDTDDTLYGDMPLNVDIKIPMHLGAQGPKKKNY